MSTLTTTPGAATEPEPESEPEFLGRFDRLWEALRRYQAGQGLCWSFLAAVVGVGGLALADYWGELPLTARGIGLDLVGVLTLVVFWFAVVAPLRWWTRPRTAAEIEARFPQLGQRIRTVVQYAWLSAERIHSEGVAPSLVAALSEETELQAGPLPLDVIVPRRRLWGVAVLAAVPVLAIVTAALVLPEWRIALARTLLYDLPYTTITVAPGNVTVEQGDNLPISVELKGRPRSRVVLQTRPAENAKAPWLSVPLAPAASGPATKRTATLEKIRKPLVYRVTAGPAVSRTSRITVRYPLALTTFEVTLSPPSYTGLPRETVKGGNLRAVVGTEAAFRMVFDQLPREAALMVSEPKARLKSKEEAAAAPVPAPAPAPQVIPLVPEGKALTARLSITRDLDYTIVARTEDGRKLPRNDYRIDARADYPPRVAFEEPAEALEVHPIAEVLNRIRAADDFGLGRVGIVYRVNDGEEKTLTARDFTGQSAKPQTASTLEETLALETLGLRPTESVTYYAFAEDNFPGGPRRTETDLRFIDIRPFKRTYRLADPGGGEDMGESTTLNELIARQRFNLNRTVRLAKQRPGDRTAPEDPLKIASFEELLAALTREVLDGFNQAAADQFVSLQQAEAAMVAAVNALDHEKNDDAGALEAEALSHLIEARRTFRFLIGKGDAARVMMMTNLRSFDRTQAQKIRKPKNQAEEAELLVAEIEELAGDEDFVYATIAQIAEDSGTLTETLPPTDPSEVPPAPGEPQPNGGQARDQNDQAGQETQDPAKEGEGEGKGKSAGRQTTRGESSPGKAAGKGKPAMEKPGDDPSSTPAKQARRGLPKRERPGEPSAEDGQDPAKQVSKKPSGRRTDRGEPGTEKTDGDAKKNQGDDQPGQNGQDDAKPGDGPQQGRRADRGEPGTGTEKAPGAGDEPKQGERADGPGMPGKKGTARGTRPAAASGSEPGPARKMDHQALTAEQGRIADEARDLEARLKRLEAASELSRLRMTKAAEAAERASGALNRGRSQEAAGLIRNGSLLLHEVARQVKGEIAREVADVVAMARDRAEEIAQREAEFAEMPPPATTSGSDATGAEDSPSAQGKKAGARARQSEAEVAGMPPNASGSDSESTAADDSRSAQGKKAGARARQSEAEMLERLAEAARTLQEWLKQVAARGEGKASATARELLDQGKMTEILRQIDRIAELNEAGQGDEARREAARAREAIDAIARALDMLHRDIVAPRLAALVEAEKRLADLSDRLDTLDSNVQVDAWHRQAVALLRDLEKQPEMAELVAELEKIMVDAGYRAEGGAWKWNAPGPNWRAPLGYRVSLQKIARKVQERIQEMVLKDMMSSRDEATPPEFRELVERYYEVLSREGAGAASGPR